MPRDREARGRAQRPRGSRAGRRHDSNSHMHARYDACAYVCMHVVVGSGLLAQLESLRKHVAELPTCAGCHYGALRFQK